MPTQSDRRAAGELEAQTLGALWAEGTNLNDGLDSDDIAVLTKLLEDAQQQRASGTKRGRLR